VFCCFCFSSTISSIWTTTLIFLWIMNHEIVSGIASDPTRAYRNCVNSNIYIKSKFHLPPRFYLKTITLSLVLKKTFTSLNCFMNEALSPFHTYFGHSNVNQQWFTFLELNCWQIFLPSPCHLSSSSHWSPNSMCLHL